MFPLLATPSTRFRLSLSKSRRRCGGRHFDLRADLHRMSCPVLLMGGTLDPMVPIENQRDIAALLPAHLLRYEKFPGAGHGLVADAPERALTLLREFIAPELPV